MRKRRLSQIVLFSLLLNHSAIAAEFHDFRSIAQTSISALREDQTVNVDQLIEQQKQLIRLGIQACTDYARAHPEDARIMQLVIDNAEAMKNLTLAQIEIQWHARQTLLNYGIAPEKIEHYGHTDIINTIIHPATAYIALLEFKKTSEKLLLERAAQELTELLLHLDHIR